MSIETVNHPDIVAYTSYHAGLHATLPAIMKVRDEIRVTARRAK
jgi:hypothetical protein